MSVSCPKFDKSGVEGKSRYIIRVYIRESNYGESKLSSDFVCVAGGCMQLFSDVRRRG